MGNNEMPDTVAHVVDVIDLVGDSVLNLHSAGSFELTVTLPARISSPPTELSNAAVIDGATLRFLSLDARNDFLAEYLFNKNQDQLQGSLHMWLVAGLDVWRKEIGNANSVSGRLLALVHESEDVFTIAAEAIGTEKMEVFDVLHVVEASLPYLSKIKPESIINLCKAQHEKTKNDLAAGMFFNKLEKLLVTLPETCRLIHLYLRTDISEATAALHPTVLLALASSSKREATTLAYEDARSEATTLRRAALWTLGLLLTSNHITNAILSAVSSTIISNMSDSDEQVRRTAIHAAVQAIIVTRKFDSTVLSLARSGNQDVLAALSHVLFSTDMKNKSSFKKWVSLLCKLNRSAVGAIRNFDFILMQLSTDEAQQQFVISCLTEWIESDAKRSPSDKEWPKLFSSTVSRIANNNKLLSLIITQWLLSDSWGLASAASGMLSYLWAHNFRSPEFSTSVLDTLDDKSLLYLARRMLGFIHSEDHLLSLTISLLKTKNRQARLFGLVHALLVDEVGADYPGSTVRMLEHAKTTAEPELISLYTSAIEKITHAMNEIETLPRIEELKPPPAFQREFAKANAKQMSSLMEEAQKESIFRQIATEIPIKAGKGWFSFRNGEYTDTSNFQSLSHSVALPRRHVLDSVGYELSRLGMRLAKRGEA
jgi:hypothetical protein